MSHTGTQPERWKEEESAGLDEGWVVYKDAVLCSTIVQNSSHHHSSSSLLQRNLSLYSQQPSKWADSTTTTGCTQATASPAIAAATNSGCKKTARSLSTGKVNLCGRTQKTSATTSREFIFKMTETLSCIPMTTKLFGLLTLVATAMRSISLCRMMEMLSCTRARMMRQRPSGRLAPTRFKHLRLVSDL